MEVKGTVVYLGETQLIGEKEFKKRELVLSIADNPQYPQEVKFEGTQDLCAKMDDLVPGTDATISFNINGRKWLDKNGVNQWFNTLKIWKFDVTKSVAKEPEPDEVPF